MTDHGAFFFFDNGENSCIFDCTAGGVSLRPSRHQQQLRSNTHSHPTIERSRDFSTHHYHRHHHHPKVMELAPPGGARTRVVGRPVMKFPEFWLDPLAYAFEDTAAAADDGAAASSASTASSGAGGGTTAASCSATSSSTAGGAGGSSIMGIGAGPSSVDSADSGVVGCVGVPSTSPCWCCVLVVTPAAAAAVGPVCWSPKLMEDAPPGGAWIRVMGLSVRKFPAFWFTPDA
ncbi:unnamed protein product [Ectocarpus sp. 13 AM-2016]